MRRNRILIYIYTFLVTFLLFRACDTLYYLEKGVSSSGYIVFIVIIYLVSLIIEVPSGIIADKYSKKKLLITNNIILLLAIILFIIADNYITLVLGIISMAFQTSLTTGIGNTIIYNSLENKNNFSKCLFYKNTCYNLSYMIAMILGGYIGQKSLVNMYYISLIPIILNFIVLFMLKETKNINNEKSNSKIILKDAITTIKSNKTIMNIFLTVAFIYPVLTILAESHPDFAKSIGINAFIIGVYTSGMLLVSIFGDYLSSKSKNKNKLMKLVSFLVGIDLLLIGLLNNKFSIIFIILAQFLCALYNNSMLSVLHSNISSNSRVTVESLLSVFQSLVGIILGVLTSILLTFIDVYVSYIIFGIITIMYTLGMQLIKKKFN
jgi:MFS family permease